MAKKNPSATKHLHICVDRVLPLSLQTEASQRAIAENPANLAFLGSHGPMRAAASPMAMALLTSRKWKNGRKLRVRFMGGTDHVQAKVVEYASEWMKYANIEFDFNNDLDAEIRIAFDPDGSWSYLGTDALTIPPGKPTMNYGWFANSTPNDEFSRTTLHEFGHALGCIHEHQHPLVGIPWDKPKVYAYYAQPPNSWSAADVDSNLFQKYSVSQTQHSAFDEKSIMLYAIPNELTIGDYEVGWNTVLSKTDKDWIAAAYPRNKPATAPTLALGKPREESIGKYGEEDLFELIVTAKGNYVIETTGKTDVVMRLMGPDNPTQIVAEDDDSGASHNARIARDLIPGTYQIRVRHYRPMGTGKYSLVARKV